MRHHLLSRHVPHPQGTAAGRVLHATRAGLLELGEEVRVTSWRPDGPAPSGEPPPGCDSVVLPAEAAARTRWRAVRRPRSDVVRLGWVADGLAVADDPLSAPALPRDGVATLHYATALDLRALGRASTPRDRQDVRAEERLCRAGRPLLAYSERVAGWASDRGAVVRAVPAAVPIPPAPQAQVEQPVAVLLADWRWRPNRWALHALLLRWPDVRARVPGARLLVAGRGRLDEVSLPGVEVRGSVADSAALLSEAAVLAFPCPPTSGPKVKVLEAAARGLCVVTTPAGAEGVAETAGGEGGAGLVVADLEEYADRLVATLADPASRAEHAARARVAVRASHAPGAAARRRLEALLELTQGP